MLYLKKCKISLLVCIVVFMACPTLRAESDFVVLSGDKQAVIVYNPDDGAYKITLPSTKINIKAHEELALYLEKATGKKFVTIPEKEFKAGNGSLPIYVGNCDAVKKAIGKELSKLDRDGFIVLVKSNQVFLAGPSVNSTIWAVEEFLQDYVGVRWLVPGKLGEDVPSLDKIVIKPNKQVEQPVLISRYWGSGIDPVPGDLEWSFHQRIASRSCASRHHPVVGRYEGDYHNMQEIFPVEKYFDQHPEYYALIKGKRTKEAYAHGANICYSEPNTIKIAAQTAIDYFKANPDAESFSFAPSDASKWCECEKCRKLFLAPPYPQIETPEIWGKDFFDIWGGDIRSSALYFNWLSKVGDEVKKVYPDKIMGTLGYDGYTLPPILHKEIVVNRSIHPFLCMTLADLWHPEHKKACYWLVGEWGKRVDSLGLYDYAYGHGNVLPRIYTPLVQEMIQFGIKNNVKAVTGEVYPSWGLDGPRLYQSARIFWNPNVDSSAVLNDWCEHMFKEAAEPMKKHFLQCEKQWVNTDQDKYVKKKRPGSIGPFTEKYTFAQGWRTTPFEIFTPTVLAEHTAYFDEAAKLAKSDLVKQRLHFFRKCWDLGVIFGDAYWAGEGMESYIARGANIKDVATVLKKMPPSYEEVYFAGEIKQRVGDDRIAFRPVPGDWMKWMVMPKPVEEAQLNWCAKQIVDEISRYYKENMLSSPPIGEAVQKQIDELFGNDGHQLYKDTVSKIRELAKKDIQQRGI